MLRTQVYLTMEEKKGLGALVKETGKSQSQLIREALDQLILKLKHSNRTEVLAKAKGMWATRKDLPDFSKIRSEFDRYA